MLVSHSVFHFVYIYIYMMGDELQFLDKALNHLFSFL